MTVIYFDQLIFLEIDPMCKTVFLVIVFMNGNYFSLLLVDYKIFSCYMLQSRISFLNFPIYLPSSLLQSVFKNSAKFFHTHLVIKPRVAWLLSNIRILLLQ